MFDSALGDIREDGVSSAKSYDGRFAEENSFSKNGMARPKEKGCQHYRRPPQKQPDNCVAHRACQRRPGMLRRSVRVIDHGTFLIRFGASVTGGDDVEF